MSRPSVLAAIIFAAFVAGGCDQLFPQDARQTMETARKKTQAGDFRAAVKLYESALDGTDKTAEAHYRLALIYDDKLKSPRDALHHFERYLDLAPNGAFASDAKTFRKQAELRVLTSLQKGSFISQEEAVRLKNENLSLRKSLVEVRARKEVATAALPAGPAGGRPKPIPPGARTHLVEPGETLASIAAKYYKNRGRWKEIQDANSSALGGSVNIKPGQQLVIP